MALAERIGGPPQAQTLIDRYIRVDPAGRGPADARLAEYGTPVWALIGYYRDAVGHDVRRVAEDYGVPVEAVEAALAFFDAHRGPIEAKLLLNAEAA